MDQHRFQNPVEASNAASTDSNTMNYTDSAMLALGSNFQAVNVSVAPTAAWQPRGPYRQPINRFPHYEQQPYSATFQGQRFSNTGAYSGYGSTNPQNFGYQAAQWPPLAASRCSGSAASVQHRTDKPGLHFRCLANNFWVLAWSLSGLETNVLVKKGKNGDLYAFDIGHAHRHSVNAEYVFISHGHVDHIADIVHHASKRNLYRLKPAQYYMPAHLVEHVREIGRQFAIMHTKFDYRLQFDNDADLNAGKAAVEFEMQAFTDMQLIGVENGKRFKLPNGNEVLPFATCHRVPSSGYIIYGKVYDKQTGETDYRPEIAYTGDTTFDVFLNPPTEDLLRVRVLICECTYVGQANKLLPKASEYKHIHLESFVQHAELFDRVEQIVLVHFSDRHTPKQIQEQVEERCPPELRNKIFCATMAQEAGL